MTAKRRAIDTYLIVKGDFLPSFEAKVNVLLSKGYHCQGGLCVVQAEHKDEETGDSRWGYFYQPMIISEDDR